MEKDKWQVTTYLFLKGILVVSILKESENIEMNKSHPFVKLRVKMLKRGLLI